MVTCMSVIITTKGFRCFLTDFSSIIDWSNLFQLSNLVRVVHFYTYSQSIYLQSLLYCINLISCSLILMLHHIHKYKGLRMSNMYYKWNGTEIHPFRQVI